MAPLLKESLSMLSLMNTGRRMESGGRRQQRTWKRDLKGSLSLAKPSVCTEQKWQKVYGISLLLKYLLRSKTALR